MDAEWNGDEWTCEVDAPAFRSLYERSGTHLAVVFLDAEEEEPPSVEQIASLERFLEVATELRPLVEDAIRAYYFSVRADYLPHLDAPEREMPQQLDGREFERLHELQQLYVHRRGENSSYQHSNFEVAEIRGHVPTEFFALGESADEMNPETLVMRIGKDRWHRCFLDAFLGFWEMLSDELIAEVLDDYGGAPRVDLLARLDLSGQRVLQATCDRSTAEGTRISILFESGSVLLRELDPSDPDSASVLEFHPA